METYIFLTWQVYLKNTQFFLNFSEMATPQLRLLFYVIHFVLKNVAYKQSCKHSAAATVVCIQYILAIIFPTKNSKPYKNIKQ